MAGPRSLELFCRVVDNFGDIGVCWRLARQLAGEHGIAVRLWVDDLASFKRICAEVDQAAEEQLRQGVVVRRWHEAMALPAPADIGDAVVEAFGCVLPPAFEQAMAQRPVPPVWINLEYLSAEDWVTGCHGLPSPHPRLPLTKYFFFPGFEAGTGGLLCEAGLEARRAAFAADAMQRANFLADLGVRPAPDALLISLFCYPQAPLTALLNALRDDQRPSLMLVPQGVASAQLAAWAGRLPAPGEVLQAGSLSIQQVPFLDQPGYDRLLWCCDLNFVRGEDSMVRAQWAQRPLVWQIYPQQEDAHRVKLDAFLALYCAGMAPEVMQACRNAWHAWNGDGDIGARWPALRASLPALQAHMAAWCERLRGLGDLAGNLLDFIAKRAP
ncbi:MAG TPA: elongation factor P maturation arginine rhamnosyltransferase EarP [Noviherbaspirillum sp.]